MPHPVGGAMGVALCTALKRGSGYTRFDIMSLTREMQCIVGRA